MSPRFLFPLAFLPLLAACAPDVYFTSSGARVPGNLPDVALRASAETDLACPAEAIALSEVWVNRASSPIDPRTLGPNLDTPVVEVADGCGRRAVYSRQCDVEHPLDRVPGRPDAPTLTACRYVLLSRFQLASNGPARSPHIG